MPNSNAVLSIPQQNNLSTSKRLLYAGALLLAVFIILLIALFTNTWIQIAIAGIPAALLLYILISQVSGKVIAPLDELSRQTERLAAGDLSRTITVNSEGEIGTVSNNINTIVRRLRESMERVKQLESLEASLEKHKANADELKLSYDNLLVVSELGQQLISSLKLDDIASTLYETLNTLMDAAMLEVGVVDRNADELQFVLSIDRNARRPAYSVPLSVQTTFSGWVVKHGREVFLNDAAKHYSRYLQAFDAGFAHGELPQSILCVPMFKAGEVTGVIVVTSNRREAYTNYHLDMVKSLALYASVALENAKAYRKLNDTLNDLKLAQKQLIQSEKMSSLGLLTAGVAHEINNPINFVSANVNPLRRNLHDVMEMFAQYQKLETSKNIPADLAEIGRELQLRDMAYTLKEIDQLLDGIQEGANRTAEIVQGLRNFSRSDEQSIRMANVHSGIDSTLMLLHSRYKDTIEIIKDYGDLPEIECFAGQLNQVFMNILSNAIQAIPTRGTIHIVTKAEGDKVELRFKDSGSGMSEDVRKHIFDPFFTTKDVGVGTGLGLSISYGIIEKHHGHVEVESAPGQGTEFIVTLPISQPRSASATETTTISTKS